MIVAAYHAWEEYVELDDEGNLRIATWREEKYRKDSLKLENCTQYALLAHKSGSYPCYTCPDSGYVFLNKDEVWYYGETCLGEKGRYGSSLDDLSVKFVPQFFGDKTACILEQKKKIIYYPILPENLARKKRLARPPANPVDN